MFVLFTDTDCDITPGLKEKLGCEFISMPYTIDGKDIYPYIDFTEYDSKAYFNLLRNGCLPKTSGLSPETYINYFEPYIKDGKDILYVHFSKAMSGTFTALKIAIDTLKEKYPNNTVYTIDTKGISAISLLILEEVSKLCKQGKSIQEILAWADENVDKFGIFFYVDNLKFFKLSGRVSNITATMGTIFDIHPIIHVNKDGVMTSLTKARGKKATLQKVISLVCEYQENIQDYTVMIAHSDAEDIAKQAEKLLEEKFGKLNIEYTVVNPTIGAHCGPDCFGIAFRSKGRLD